MKHYLGMLMVAGLIAGGCNKKTTDGAGAAKTAEAANKTEPATTCPPGLTDPGVGACMKVPTNNVKPQAPGNYGGAIKNAQWGNDDGTHYDVKVSAKSGFFADHVKSLRMGGGFGGKLETEGKLGADGMWGVFTSDDGQNRKISASLSQGKTTEVECYASRSAVSTAQPPLDEVMDFCKTIVAQ